MTRAVLKSRGGERQTALHGRGQASPAKNFALLAILFVTGFGAASEKGQTGTPERTGRQGRSVVTWPAPAGEKLSGDYTLRVNGQVVPVYSCRVSAMPFNQEWPGYQRPLGQTELAGFAYWSMSGPVRVEVIATQPFKSVAVRPASLRIQPVIKGRRITFRLTRSGQTTLELDGTHHALHLFADPLETDTHKPGDSNVLYFGPGVHRPGKIELRSGQTLYVAGGAVVYTAIAIRGASGVRILGRGIIDTSEFERGQGGGAIRLSDSSDVKIDGVILRDPDEWCLSAFGCRNLAISNVKLIGLWRYNSDGIDICNSEDVTIRDSFVRSFDDGIVLKGVKWTQESYDGRPVRNVRASGLVVWCDWGRALKIGAETSAPEVANVAFRDIDVIRTTHAALAIQHIDRAAVHGIRFEDVRVEVDDLNPQPLLQKEGGQTYRPDPNAGYIPSLFVITIVEDYAERQPRSVRQVYDWRDVTSYGRWYLHHSADEQRGTVRDVVFKDVSVRGKPMPPSSFAGLDTDHDVKGVTIENLRVNGRLVNTAEDARLKLGKYVQDVRFIKNRNRQ